MQQRKFSRILAGEWDAIAGVIAAVVALVMHFLHLVEADVLLMILLALMALLFVRNLRRERLVEDVKEMLGTTQAAVAQIQRAIEPADALLIGPDRLRPASQAFSERAAGEMIWFNVCLLMFRPQSLFDVLLRPAIENPLVTRIQFVIDPKQRSIWEEEVIPKIATTQGGEKVVPPRWVSIPETVSIILAERGGSQRPETLLSVWGEPFMAHSATRDVPRYIFHVQGQSELNARLAELARDYRFES